MNIDNTTNINNNNTDSNNNNTNDTDNINRNITVKFRELSKGEVWGYRQQIEMLVNRKKELEEAGIYDVSGQNKIQKQHREEYRQLEDAISILQQKAAGAVNPQPIREQKAVTKPKETRKAATQAERAEMLKNFAELKKSLRFAV
tara:strand:+ start:126 stop:560 length:435 start_codon:yes stop_codon:yes gene_type:complete